MVVLFQKLFIRYVLFLLPRKGNTQTLSGGRRNTGGGYGRLQSLVEDEDDTPKKSKRTMTFKPGKKSTSVTSSSPPAHRKSSESRNSFRESLPDRSSLVSDDSQKSPHLDTYEDVKDIMDPDRLSIVSSQSSQQSNPLPAPPAYPAPRPPSMVSDDDEADSRHSYEKVVLNSATGGVTIVETEEWAELPGAKEHPMYQHGLGKRAPPTKDSPKVQPKDARYSASSDGSSGGGSGGGSEGSGGGSGSVGVGARMPPPLRQDSANFLGSITSGRIFESLYDGIAPTSAPPPPPPPSQTVPEPITENIYEFDRLPSPPPSVPPMDSDIVLDTHSPKKGLVGDRARKHSPTPPPPLPPPYVPPAESLGQSGMPSRPPKPGTSPPGQGQQMAAATRGGEEGSPHLALPPLPTGAAGSIPPAIPIKKRGDPVKVEAPGTGPQPPPGIAPRPSEVSSVGVTPLSPNLNVKPAEVTAPAPIPTKVSPVPSIDEGIYGFDSLSPKSASPIPPKAVSVPTKTDPLPPIPPSVEQTKPFSTRPLPQPVPDDGNQDYAFDLLMAHPEDDTQDTPPQAVNFATVRPLPQPPPDDGNEIYSFDTLMPPPQTGSHPQPNDDYVFDMLSAPPSHPPPPLPPDDGNQDYSFDTLLPSPPPVPAKVADTASPSSKLSPQKATPITASTTPTPQGADQQQLKPLPPPPTGGLDSRLPPDNGDQDYTFDTLIPPPTPPKNTTSASVLGKPPLVSALKPSQSPPVPPKSKLKGTAAPVADEGGAQTQDFLTTSLDMSAKTVAMPPKPQAAPPKPAPVPSKTLKPANNLPKPGVPPGVPSEQGPLEPPPLPPPNVGGMLANPHVKTDPLAAAGAVPPRKPAAPPVVPPSLPPTLPEARPIMTTPTGISPAPKGNMAANMLSVTAEYCLLGHEEMQGGEESGNAPSTPSRGKMNASIKGKRTDPISVPSKSSTSTLPKPSQPPSARRNMPVSVYCWGGVCAAGEEGVLWQVVCGG